MSTNRLFKNLLLFMLCLLIASSMVGCGKIQEQTTSTIFDSLSMLDMNSADLLAKKLPEDSYVHDSIAQMKRFLAAREAGDWAGAQAIYNADDTLPNTGPAVAAYLDCCYHKMVEPAGPMLERGEVAAAIESLLEFDSLFHAWNPHYSPDRGVHIGSYTTYTTYSEENAKAFQQLVEQAGKAALDGGDMATVDLLADFEESNTVVFSDYSWSDDYAAAMSKYAETIAATPFASAQAMVAAGKLDEARTLMTEQLSQRIIGSDFYPYYSEWTQSTLDDTDLAGHTPYDAFATVFAGHEDAVPIKTWKSLLAGVLLTPEELETGLSRLASLESVEQNSGFDLRLPPLTWLNILSEEQAAGIGTAPQGKALIVYTNSDTLRQYTFYNINNIILDTAQFAFYEFSQAIDLGAMIGLPAELYPENLGQVEFLIEVTLDQRDSDKVYYRSDTNEKYDANSYVISACVRLWQYGGGERTLLHEWDEVTGRSADSGEISQQALFGGYPDDALEGLFSEAVERIVS